MADPVTLAMVGAAAGAVTNKKDPLKGALLGAALGGGGGMLAGAGAAGAAAAPSSGLLAGITPMGVQAAGSLGAIPAAVPGGGALLSGAAQSAAAPTLMSRLASPQALLAGAQLAGSMTPQQAQTAPMQATPGRPIPMAFQPPPMAMSPVGRYGEMFPLREDLGAFGVPTMFRTQVRPGEDEMLLNYFPGRR